MSRRLGILISGRGSNLEAIVAATDKGELDATVAIVLSDRAGAAGLEIARRSGIEARCLRPRDYAGREAYDAALATVLREFAVDLVCLAGFMRLVGQPLLEAYRERILNIHPSLLPAFPGLEAQRQALEHGVRVSGATVHFVDADLDAGPIILQTPVPVLDDDTVETLSRRILSVEHQIYPKAIGQVLDGGWHIEGRRFVRRAR